MENTLKSDPFISGRGGNFCRGCESVSLFSALNLGLLPIANELPQSEIVDIERFPLHLKICRDCGLGQVEDVITPTRIFRDYRYLSSMSSTFVTHAANFVDYVMKENLVASGDWVLEIASNDGYLLQHFKKHHIKSIGVEPAENVAKISETRGIKTISEFFTLELAKQLVSEYGFPKLIIANNVMAHVPDLPDFLKGLRALCGPNTVISVENPSLMNILVGNQFDTIYHEHYSYLSAFSVDQICKLHGLQLFRVDAIDIHGGSNRYWIRGLQTQNPIDHSVEMIIEHEKNTGLFDTQSWGNYSLRVAEIVSALTKWIENGFQEGGQIYGYGAAAKASTLLNLISLKPNMLKGIADKSPEKQGRFLPSHLIEIISPEELAVREPSDVLIFPWNLRTEISIYLRDLLGPGVKLWCAVPSLEEIKIL